VAEAVIEDVHAMPGKGNSPQTGYSLGHSRATIESVLALVGFVQHTSAVQPQTWKRAFALSGKGKPESLEMARRLYPAAAHDLRLVKHHNRAESVLLAHYGRVKLA
jgi:crossover junction endodeoxyribonuclease RuvC